MDELIQSMKVSGPYQLKPAAAATTTAARGERNDDDDDDDDDGGVRDGRSVSSWNNGHRDDYDRRFPSTQDQYRSD